MTVRHARQATCPLPLGQWNAPVQRCPGGVGAGASGGGIDPGGHVCVVQRQHAARHRRLQRSMGSRRASKHECKCGEISQGVVQQLQIDLEEIPFPSRKRMFVRNVSSNCRTGLSSLGGSVDTVKSGPCLPIW